MLTFKQLQKDLKSYLRNLRKKAVWKKMDQEKIIMIATIIIAVGLAALLSWLIFSSAKKSNNPQDAVLIEQVAGHLLLPSEKPEITKIKNSAELIQQQPFYQGTRDGDVLLIFSEAKKAVIYSPSRDIIINAGPIYTGQEVEGLK